MTDATNETRPVRLVEGPVVYLPREEFGLIDLAIILVRRWYWIIVGLALVWAATYWSLSRTPVRYESRGVVRIGRNRVSVPNTLLEAGPVAALRISREYAAHSFLGKKYGGASISDATFDRGADELLTIAARASSPDTAREFLDAVLTEFVAGHQSLFTDERQAIEARLKVIGTEIERVATERQSLEQMKTKPDQIEVVLAVQQLSRAQFLQQQVVLEQEAIRLQRDLLHLQSPPTTRISDPTWQGAPVEPRRSLIWQMGTGLGLLFGLALAFGFEFLLQVIRQMRQPDKKSRSAV